MLFRSSLTSKPDLYVRGFVYIKENEEVMNEARDLILNTVISSNFKNQDWAVIKNNITRIRDKFLFMIYILFCRFL